MLGRADLPMIFAKKNTPLQNVVMYVHYSAYRRRKKAIFTDKTKKAQKSENFI